MAAARVSRRDASVWAGRYPRLCSATPEVSRQTEALSFRIEKRILYSAPVSGNFSSLYRVFSRSTTAFLMMRWQSGTENRAESRLYPVTGKAASRGSQSSQGRALTPSNSASKLRAGKLPISSSTRSPQRRLRFAFAQSPGEPVKKTRPSSARTSARSSLRSSSAARPSRPNRQGTQKVKLCLIIMILTSLNF